MSYSKNKNAFIRVEKSLTKILNIKPGQSLPFIVDPPSAGLFAFHLRQGIAYCKENSIEPYNHLQVSIKVDTKMGLITVSKKQQYEVRVLDEKIATKFNDVTDMNGIILTMYNSPNLQLYEFPYLDNVQINQIDLINYAKSNGYIWHPEQKQLERMDGVE